MTMMCVASGSRPADCCSAVMQAAIRAASFRVGTTTPTRQVMTVPRHEPKGRLLVGAEQSEAVRLAQMLVHLVAAQHVRVAVAPPVHGDQRASRFQAGHRAISHDAELRYLEVVAELAEDDEVERAVGPVVR